MLLSSTGLLVVLEIIVAFIASSLILGAFVLFQAKPRETERLDLLRDEEK